jgi:hypothetical protein
MPTPAERLLEELIRARAPAGTIRAEGFTPREIRDARKRIDVDTSLERSIGPAAGETQ